MGTEFRQALENVLESSSEEEVRQATFEAVRILIETAPDETLELPPPNLRGGKIAFGKPDVFDEEREDAYGENDNALKDVALSRLNPEKLAWFLESYKAALDKYCGEDKGKHSRVLDHRNFAKALELKMVKADDRTALAAMAVIETTPSHMSTLEYGDACCRIFILLSRREHADIRRFGLKCLARTFFIERIDFFHNPAEYKMDVKPVEGEVLQAAIHELVGALIDPRNCRPVIEQLQIAFLTFQEVLHDKFERLVHMMPPQIVAALVVHNRTNKKASNEYNLSGDMPVHKIIQYCRKKEALPGLVNGMVEALMPLVGEIKSGKFNLPPDFFRERGTR